MSIVTNIILSISLSENVFEDDKDKGIIEEVNKFFGDRI